MIVFRSGHARPHVVAIGVPVARIETTIRRQISEDIRQASATGSFWGRVTIQDVIVEYRAYTLTDGTISVGTYYRP
jgi:hypothetical protein